MGRKSTSGGAIPKGADKIQLDFWYNGRRYRPTLDLRPTKTNLDHARKRLADIRRRVDAGTFNFAEEFPEYRFIDTVGGGGSNQPTFNQVADQYVASIGNMAHATKESYKKILNHFWRPRIGHRIIADIKYTELAAIVGGEPWGSNKTRNNVVSVGRQVFEFAYADSDRRNPADKLKSLRVQKQPPDPYTVEEVERLIAGIRQDWSQDDADYVEFGFFTGCRPSELIALRWSDIDLQAGIMRVERARVMGHDKSTTKTSSIRDVELCPRALAVLKRRRAVSQLAGGAVLTNNGVEWHDLQLQWRHWQYTHKRLKMRYREPYQMRHTSVTWNLMIGRNLLHVAEQHGHSAAVMLKTYAKWLKGSTDKSVEAISAAMGFGTDLTLAARK